jgi:CheY-like chemotaxis protein
MKKSILVVEDEDDSADLLRRMLERQGYSVVLAKDGRQVLDMIEIIRPTALILLDMVIPYVNGIELLRVIRRHTDWKQVPIVAVSANSYPPDIQRALDEGATIYHPKSNSHGTLLKSIQTLLGSAVETSGAEGLPESDGHKASQPRRKAR